MPRVSTSPLAVAPETVNGDITSKKIIGQSWPCWLRGKIGLLESLPLHVAWCSCVDDICWRGLFLFLISLLFYCKSVVPGRYVMHDFHPCCFHEGGQAFCAPSHHSGCFLNFCNTKGTVSVLGGPPMVLVCCEHLRHRKQNIQRGNCCVLLVPLFICSHCDHKISFKIFSLF